MKLHVTLTGPKSDDQDRSLRFWGDLERMCARYGWTIVHEAPLPNGLVELDGRVRALPPDGTPAEPTEEEAAPRRRTIFGVSIP